MTDWTELPGFTKTYASSCAPWGSAARLVNGVIETKNGRPVTLSGAKAFAQRLEAELIAAYETTKDVPALVSAVLEAHAKHIDAALRSRESGRRVERLRCRVAGAAVDRARPFVAAVGRARDGVVEHDALRA